MGLETVELKLKIITDLDSLPLSGTALSNLFADAVERYRELYIDKLGICELESCIDGRAEYFDRENYFVWMQNAKRGHLR